MTLGFLQARIVALREQGLWRTSAFAQSSGIDVSSNDYLGYAARTVSRETADALRGSANGAGASRFIHGTAPEHLALEAAVAEWVGLPAALLFSSGYAANVGLLAALAAPEDVIVSDALNHASIIDGCRLARARVAVVPHRDTSAVENALRAHATAERRWVVTESDFSMDGDSPDLPALRALCDEHRAALVVDEAHALGVHGPGGAGICSRERVIPTLLSEPSARPSALRAPSSRGRPSSASGSGIAHGRSSSPPRRRPVLARLCLQNVQNARRDDAARATLARHHATLTDELRRRGVALPKSLAPVGSCQSRSATTTAP